MTIKIHRPDPTVVRKDGNDPWFISFTPSRKTDHFAWYAWATRSPAPRDADVMSMLRLGGDVRFALGETPADARDRLERDLYKATNTADALSERARRSPRSNQAVTNTVAYVMVAAVVVTMVSIALLAIAGLIVAWNSIFG